MTKKKQREYIAWAARRYGRVKLVFGHHEAGCMLMRTLDKKGFSRHKFPGDASYYDSCFMWDYACGPEDRNGNVEINPKKLNLDRTLREMYSYDRYDDASVLLEIRVGKGYRKVLKRF